MANHGAAAALLIASLLVAVTIAGARVTVHLEHDMITGYKVNYAKAAVPALNCNKVHGIQTGETCFSVAQGAGLTLDQFLGFNPNINCEKVFVAQWVCLDAVAA